MLINKQYYVAHNQKFSTLKQNNYTLSTLMQIGNMKWHTLPFTLLSKLNRRFRLNLSSMQSKNTFHNIHWTWVTRRCYYHSNFLLRRVLVNFHLFTRILYLVIYKHLHLQHPHLKIHMHVIVKLISPHATITFESSALFLSCCTICVSQKYYNKIMVFKITFQFHSFLPFPWGLFLLTFMHHFYLIFLSY